MIWGGRTRCHGNQSLSSPSSAFSRFSRFLRLWREQLQRPDGRLHPAAAQGPGAVPLPKAADGSHPAPYVPERVDLWTWSTQTQVRSSYIEASIQV